MNPDQNKSERVTTLFFIQHDPAIQPWRLQTETALYEVARLLAADTIRMRGWPLLTDLSGNEIVVNPATVACVTREERQK